MGKNLGWTVTVLAVGAAAAFAGQARHLVRQMPEPASVFGRVTAVERVNKTTATDPVPHVKVYLFTYAAGKPFRDLQQKCRRAMADRFGDPERIYRVCDQAMTDAFNLVPTLPAIASGETGRDGDFAFDNLAPGRDYQLIGIKPEEGGSPIVIVKTIKRLHSGDKIKMELSENDPWTGPLVVR
jgi:hypothetical protein